MVTINKSITRNRILYFVLITAIIILGLCSRKFAKSLPLFLADYSGDTLWALMVFCGVGFLKPSWSTLKVVLVSLVFSYFIEITQLYHAPWIEAIRHNKLGGLILGYAFLWSDIVCYTVGISIGLLCEVLYQYFLEKNQQVFYK